MLDFLSFYEGHKGAVLSLAGDPGDNYFFTSGTEGLIVRWSLAKPNEGDVITRLQGLVPAIAYAPQSKRIYAALNQKGIVVLDSQTAISVGSVSIPATSFTRMLLLEDFLIVSTNKSEIQIVELETLKVISRIEAGTTRSPFIAEGKQPNTFWYNDISGIRLMDLVSQSISAPYFNRFGELQGLGAMGDHVLALANQEMMAQNMYKNRARPVKGTSKETLVFLKGSLKAPALLAATADFGVLTIGIDEKTVQNGPKSQILHNGAINDLLWSENHKFVLSASADKTIGVWRFN